MRTRIVAVITVVTALCLLAVGVSVALVERQRVLEAVDERLQANLESARIIVSEGDPARGAWASSMDALTAVVKRMSPDDHTGALGMEGDTIRIVPGILLDLDLRDARDFARHVHAQLDGEPIIGTYAAQDDAWRYLAVPVSVAGSPAPTTVTFVMAYDLNAELAELNGATRMFLIASGIAVLIVALASIAVATRLLRPLRRMRETAERISAESLDERLPVVGNDDVAELTVTINDMLDRLDHAVDAQRTLLSDVGHELKTPLTIVRGNIELMDETKPPDVIEARQLALEELDRMTQLVQDLGDAAAVFGRKRLDVERLDVEEFLEGIARKARGIQGATVTVTAVEPGHVMADPARVTQAILQLVHNAVTHGGGRVELSSRNAGSRVEFAVRDFGGGVPEEAKSAIFERFYRARDAAGRSGSGLGLSIVSMIARAHRGEVRVRAADGGGAEFILSIPMSAEHTEGSRWHRF